MPSSVTLVDANVVIYAHEQGTFPALLDGNPLAVCPQVIREAVYFVGPAGRIPITLTPFLNTGRLQLQEATIAEVQTFTVRCPRSGLGAGETESLAIVLSRTMSFCTGDQRAMKVMHLLGLGACWCPLEQLYTNSTLDGTLLEPQWRSAAWPRT